MSVGSGIAIFRQASFAGYFAGALALGVVAMAGTFAAHATETLRLKTVVSVPNGGKITSFDISFVDTGTGMQHVRLHSRPDLNFYCGRRLHQRHQQG
jgi:hypothetical protein